MSCTRQLDYGHDDIDILFSCMCYVHLRLLWIISLCPAYNMVSQTHAAGPAMTDDPSCCVEDEGAVPAAERHDDDGTLSFVPLSRFQQHLASLKARRWKPGKARFAGLTTTQEYISLLRVLTEQDVNAIRKVRYSELRAPSPLVPPTFPSLLYILYTYHPFSSPLSHHCHTPPLPSPSPLSYFSLLVTLPTLPSSLP
jgi:hypothetical protein